MEVSSQLRALAALPPGIGGWPQSHSGSGGEDIHVEIAKITVHSKYVYYQINIPSIPS
jgi:hypothetical protein